MCTRTYKHTTDFGLDYKLFIYCEKKRQCERRKETTTKLSCSDQEKTKIVQITVFFKQILPALHHILFNVSLSNGSKVHLSENVNLVHSKKKRSLFRLT